ncbi:MAG: hypothetical protein OEV72_11755 [Thermoleophilia bacterium]|nr:hypothetical protein [Thermoleophilia bacterium]
MTALLLAHAGATLAMAGLAWFVQVVHYPLFARVGDDAFVAYEAEHVRRTTLVVAPLMIVEAVTAGLLLVLSPSALTAVGAVLVVLVWLSTALVQIPLHRRLERGFDAPAQRALVRTSWARTALWSARGAVALALVA